MREFPEDVATAFRDPYIFEFLDLPADHSEKDLKAALLANLKTFILELGRDFAFMGEEYRLQVGNTDFAPDLIFFHRRLQSSWLSSSKRRCFSPVTSGSLIST